MRYSTNTVGIIIAMQFSVNAKSENSAEGTNSRSDSLRIPIMAFLADMPEPRIQSIVDHQALLQLLVVRKIVG